MAFPQVEVASSFGCVLKDRNKPYRLNRDCNSMASAATQAAFQRNLRELVRDHLHNRISVSPEDENLQSHAYNNTNINNHRQNLRCLTNFPDDNNNNPNNSSKQARILDRWAAEQAEEMLSTIESHSQAPELSIASHKSSSSSENNSQNSDNLSGSSNLGASSLVQMWEARLHPPDPKMNPSINMKNNPTSGSSSSSSSPPPSSSRISAANENSMADWDSIAPSSRASVQLGRSFSDGGESERVRIVDIIKRLASDTSNDHDQGSSVGEPSLRRNFCASESADQLKAFSVAFNVNSPKIRGRQAINDLLLRMEKERGRELNLIAERQSVSRFPQRSRIQSMLRLRFLQRGMGIKDRRIQSIQLATASNPNGPHQGSPIMSLRSRFSRGVADDGTSSMTAAATSETGKERKNSTVNNEKPSTLEQVIKNNEQQAASLADDSLSQMSEVHEDVHEETSASSDVTWQGTSSEANNFDPGEVFELTPSVNNWDANETNDEDFGDTNYDWITDIARPRSYWEDRRKEWYQQMLTASSDNNEIRQLLERRTVSTFLDSDFREKMDQMIKSHVQIQATQEDEELEEEDQERMGQFILSFLQSQSLSSGNQEEEEEAVEGRGDAEEEEEEEDGQILIEVVIEDKQEEEESQASIFSPSPSTWNYSYHDEVADDSHPSLQSEASNPEGRISSIPNHASTEMDLMYDLRRHMEQLQCEMSELRKAMQTCMEMQANSVKQEVHPVEVAAKNSFDMTTKKRNCCICYEMQVDSFLYRCGHMCACIKCAHELQCIIGKYPICRAPILDVVRAYIDS